MNKLKDNKMYTMIFSAILIISMFAGAYFIVTKNNEPKLKNIESHIEGDYSINTTDPKTTLANFIQVNGTMGEVKEVDEKMLEQHIGHKENLNRRQSALKKIKNAIVPGGGILSGSEESNLKNYLAGIDHHHLYRVENIKVSEPSEPFKHTIYSSDGPIEYEAVNLVLSFDSIKTVFLAPRDTSFDGTYKIVENKEHFDNLEATLIKSGDLWFIDDIDGAEDVADRFATWSGTTVPKIDPEKDVIVGEKKIKFTKPEGL